MKMGEKEISKRLPAYRRKKGRNRRQARRRMTEEGKISKTRRRR
jgi:hypothetical protein